jgi:hypothetical protein
MYPYCLPCLMKDQVWSENSVYMTRFHIAYSLCHILGALSYILTLLDIPLIKI